MCRVMNLTNLALERKVRMRSGSERAFEIQAHMLPRLSEVALLESACGGGQERACGASPRTLRPNGRERERDRERERL